MNYKYRGFGYWCWKPQIILKTLEIIEEGSILIYADSGCNLNINGMEKLYKYFDIAIVNGLLTVEIDIKDRKFTKYDLFEYFNVLDNEDITDTNIRVATSIIMIKNDNNIKMVKEWMNVFYNDMHLVDDTPSLIKNSDDFIEHRHDQSIFSILSKLYNAATINLGNDDTEPILHSRHLHSTFINKIAWFIPVKSLRDKLKVKLFNLGKKIYYEIFNRN